MQATRLWAAACLAALVSASSPGCDDNDRRPTPSCVDCGGESGTNNGDGLGGDTSNLSGSSTMPNGGAGATSSNAGAPAGGGTAGHGGQQGSVGGAAGAAGAAGGTADPGSEQLELCARLAQGAQDADAVARSYVTGVYADCRVGWLVPRGQALADLLNQLVGFSYNFWGCRATLPVDAFGLVLGTPALSQGDVNLLIDDYLLAAQNKLDLSPAERETMQAALIRLSKPLIAGASLEPSHANCPVPTGGAGGADAGGAGAGGVDVGGAGAGGAAANTTGGAP